MSRKFRQTAREPQAITESWGESRTSNKLNTLSLSIVPVTNCMDIAARAVGSREIRPNPQQFQDLYDEP
jgi:hypothetical protein